VLSQKNLLPLEAEYVSGCAMLIKTRVLKKVGLFDDQFFLYYEDVDFCLRANKKGFEIWVNPQASISHALSKSAGKGSKVSIYNQTKSALIFGEKYFNSPFKRVFNSSFILFQSILFTVKAPRNGIWAFKAIWDNLTQKHRFKKLLFLSLLVILTFGTFWRVLYFDFWKDDWFIMWCMKFGQSSCPYYHHPATLLQFFVLTHLFEQNAVLWQLFGIIMRIIISFLVGIFLYKLTLSKLSGFISGVFMAVSYAGLESIYFPSGQTVALVAIPLLISLIYFINALNGKKGSIWLFTTFLLLGIILDPARIIPILALIPIIYYLVPSNKKKLIKKLLVWFYILCTVLGVPILTLWLFAFSSHSLLVKSIFNSIHNPLFFLSKIRLIGNLFASVANIFTGIIYSLQQDEHNTGLYSKLFGRIGAVIIVSGIGFFLYFLKKKSRTAGIISLFTFWTFLFYLPNWLSEPRAPMAGPHRYIFLSSIGFICLIAFLLSKIKYKWIIILLSIIFISLNIYKTNSILNWQSSYRSIDVVEGIWKTVDNDVEKGQQHVILAFVGEQPWLSQSIELSASAPFMLRRNIHGNVSGFPVMTRDPSLILSYLCPTSKKIIKIHIAQVYEWEVLKGGKLKNVSVSERRMLKNLAKDQSCALNQN